MWRCWPAQGPNWTSQIGYDVVESLLRKLSVGAALMSFVPIATTCNGPLEAAHVSIDDDRYHTMWLNVALLAGRLFMISLILPHVVFPLCRLCG